MRKIHLKPHHVKIGIKSIFWFTVGAALGLFLLLSFVIIFFKASYINRIYPGVYVAGVNFGGYSPRDVKNYFAEKNAKIANTIFILQNKDQSVTVSAKDLGFGYDENLLTTQAMSIGKSPNFLSNVSLILQAYFNGVNLPPAYRFSQDKLTVSLKPFASSIDKAPVEALFQFENGRVTAFRPSINGQTIDTQALDNKIFSYLRLLLLTNKSQTITISIPIKIVKPQLTTDKVNNLGIKELIGTGTSLFQDSIDSRIYNVELAASRLNGVLIAPGETFSFDRALGDVSAFTGYKQAYIISGGHTILGGGGGVCQVSTTFFRALLNAGLPITERHAHDYRVGYYEEDSPPGFDATVYVPTVDLKFQNTTGHYILVQSVVDPNTLRLTFYLYGTLDGRQVSITQPVITNQIPAPPPLYQDDPTLPKGVVKQTDFSANGATVIFSRTVTQNGKTIIAETYRSVYQPWQAVYLRGTQ